MVKLILTNLLMGLKNVQINSVNYCFYRIKIDNYKYKINIFTFLCNEIIFGISI